MKPRLLGYKIGLAIIGIFAIGLLVAVLMQSGANKQDNQTSKTANAIADKLNNYEGSKQIIPRSLAEVGVKSVPPTITYEVKGKSSYEFCVTYKKNSNNFNASSVVQDVVFNGMSAGGAGYSGNGGNDQSSNYFLLLLPEHHKGKNCQTVSLYSSDPSSASILPGTDTSQYYTN